MSSCELPFERPLGAWPAGAGRVEFRVWSPRAQRGVAVRLGGEDHALADVGHGVHEAELAAEHGADYEIVLDGRAWPDPWSRWQPHGIDGPSRVLDCARFEWRAAARPRPSPAELVIYELHVGTFTPEGTFEAAIAHLGELRELGVSAVEVMPVAEFGGERGWGYDGVFISAAYSAYGGPLGFQRFVDAAHELGLGVILDVVHNHVGAAGVDTLEAFGPFFTERYGTFWGKAINFDDEDCGAVREWVLQSCEGWIRDFRVDGLRLDAVHAIYDSGARPILCELGERAHALGALVIAESDLNDPRTVSEDATGLDAQWADDFHHSLHALLSGEDDGYYGDFGRLEDLAAAYRSPFVYDGRYSQFRRRRVGAPAGRLPRERFVVCSQNHDQVGNRAFGDRPARETRRLAAFCVLLSPYTPLLFMGEEYGEDAPFQYFCDHRDPELARATREGRRREFAHFASFGAEEVPDPLDPETFTRSKLTREGDPALRELYARLLAVRRELPAGEPDDVAYDAQEGWLQVRRGAWRILCNFAREQRLVPCETGQIVLAAGEARAQDGGVLLGPLSGALAR